MAPAERTKMKTNIETQEEEYIGPSEVATKRWSSSRDMDVDARNLRINKNTDGASTVQEEEAYEGSYECQPRGTEVLVLAGRGWGSQICTTL